MRRKGICASVTQHQGKSTEDSKMGTPSSVSIIEDVDLESKALEIVYCTNGAELEGIADINGHRKKEVGKGKSVSWGGAQTKCEGCKCELTKNMFFHSDLLKLCHKEKRKITEFFTDTTVFYDYKTCDAN